MNPELRSGRKDKAFVALLGDCLELLGVDLKTTDIGRENLCFARYVRTEVPGITLRAQRLVIDLGVVSARLADPGQIWP